MAEKHTGGCRPYRGPVPLSDDGVKSPGSEGQRCGSPKNLLNVCAKQRKYTAVSAHKKCLFLYETSLRMKASICCHELWKKRRNLENPIFFNAGTEHLCSAGGMAE
jgi:hypothetical protein